MLEAVGTGEEEGEEITLLTHRTVADVSFPLILDASESPSLIGQPTSDLGVRLAADRPRRVVERRQIGASDN